MPVDDKYTVVLLHFDGDDASTNFIDESNKIWTTYGGAQLSIADYKFPPSSGLFANIGDYLSTPNHTDFDMGTGDWTVEAWVNVPNDVNTKGIFGTGDSTGLCIYIASSKLRVVGDASGGFQIDISGDFTEFNEWAHIVAVRYGNTLYLYVNGNERATADVTGYNYNSGGAGAVIGRLFTGTDDYYLRSSVDELRVTKGLARYTGPFTPPTYPFLPPTQTKTYAPYAYPKKDVGVGSSYEVWLTDDAGRRMFLLDKFISMAYARSSLYLSTIQFQYNFREWADKIQPFFRPDWRIDVWRSPAQGYPLRREEMFMLRKPEVYDRIEDGIRTIMLRGRNGMDFLRRRWIIQDEETAYTSKTDYIDDMMKAFVREQCLYGSCLDMDGVSDNDRAFPQGEFTVHGDVSLGPSVTKSCAGRNLLDVLRELYDQSVALNLEDSTNRKIYFGVVPIELDGTSTTLAEPAARTGYQFRTFADRRGSDRTDGVVFSVENGNLQAPTYIESHFDEVNAVYIRGKGEGTLQSTYELENLNLISESRWNRCEVIRNASFTEDNDTMIAEANAALGEGRPIVDIDCTFLNSPGSENTPRSLYGVDWDLGDILTVDYADKQFEVEIFNVYVSVNQFGQENITGRTEQVGGIG